MQSSIADKLLQQLEDQYNQIQQMNISQPNHQYQSLSHYQCLDEDDNDDDDEHNNMPSLQQPYNPQSEYHWVEPVIQQQVKIQIKTIEIDCQKIKSMTLDMKIDVPLWINDQKEIQKRIKNLFHKKKDQKQQRNIQ